MIKILLADDDILALNRLSQMIDWNANGYEITGQAMNGNDCLKLLDSLQPDILILDIDMPDKNGVEVTRQIQEKQLSVKILILSNYDTFSFVRDAMRFGAYDYLLKHQLNADILLSKLQECKELMLKEGANISHLSFFTTVAKQKYLNGLLRNGITNPQEHAHMLTQQDFACGSYCLGVMQITNFILVTHFSANMEREKMIESITTLATNIFSSLGNGLITYLEYGQFAILFHYSNENSTQQLLTQTERIMRLLSANINKVFGLNALTQISDIFTNIGQLPAIFQKTRQLLEQKPFSPESDVTPALLKLSEEKELMNAMSALDTGRTKQLLQDIFTRCSQSAGGISQQLISQLLQIGVRFQQNQKVALPPDNAFSRIDMGHMQPQEILSFLTGWFCALLEHAPGYGSRRYSPHIQKALLFIHENYGQDISLNTLAQELHVSPTHLSRLFRKEVETSFIDYLVSYRIERARQLLQTSDLDLKTIGESVGFHGYNYFLRAYKEKTGHTPSQDMT